MNDTDRAQIRTVSVDKAVSMPDTVFFFGSKQAWLGAVGGALGAVAAEGMLDDKGRLQKLLQDNKIQVGQMFRTELQSQLASKKAFPAVTDSGGDARFVISVANYGLFKKSSFDGDLRPAIWADVSLLKADGSILWQQRVKPEASEDRLPAHDLPYYEDNPWDLRDAFSKLVKLLSAEIIADITAKD
ncbi:MAG: hypothetical protein WAQ08_02030 [Aquabacterium sp.]|uniref:hypothetical protein n=1 Tax=Aquabacterium sp. TaxID=1872578 RepID=UPI003BB19C80